MKDSQAGPYSSRAAIHYLRGSPLLPPARLLDDPDLLLRQLVQLIHQLINLLIRGIYLPLQQFPVLPRCTVPRRNSYPPISTRQLGTSVCVVGLWSIVLERRSRFVLFAYPVVNVLVKVVLSHAPKPQDIVPPKNQLVGVFARGKYGP